MPDQRPSPENFLHRAREEERRKKRGKLKIYLGAAPGVGKTYTMLQDAIEKRAKDLDVVVGIVESHGRHDIESLLEKLEIMPRQPITYRDKTWMELDLDAILQRAPGLVLIDEMAHTNAPGLPHAKRWQDINEILERGIDVYTTINVQHIESLKDDIAQIIQAPITETVPDSIIERADTIELVDLPSDDLLKRLQEGKVYIPKQAELAAEHFFRKGNLTALRELALRITAERVGTDVLLYRQDEGITKIWPTKDKILVCVGSQPGSLKLIRAAKRMANSLHAEWIAVYVDTPRRRLSAHNHNRAIENLRLAELLGAQTHVLPGYDIVNEVMNFAREQNVTQIMIRKQILTRWRAWFSRSLADEMVRNSGEIDVYIMTVASDEPHAKPSASDHPVPWQDYGIAAGAVVLATLFDLAFQPFLATSSLLMVYFLSIILVALLGRRGPSILVSILSVIAFSLFFIPEGYRFAISNIKYFPSIAVMLIVTQIISYLTFMTRKQTESARANQRQTTALYTFSRQLTATRGVGKLVALGTRYLANMFNSDVEALLPKNIHHEIKLVCQSKKTLDTKDQGIAQWVYEMGQVAGLGTTTLTSSNAVYLPILGSDRPLGVLRIQPKSQLLFTPEQMGLLESCIHQLALAMEVEHFHEKERKEELKAKADRARSLLLRSISNDLHKPLNMVFSVIDKLRTIRGDKVRLVEKELDAEVGKLTHLNNNIVQVMSLESRAALQKTPCSLEEIIVFSLNISSKILKKKPVHTNIAENLPTVLLNKKLIQDVFINLFDRAADFIPADAPVHIHARVEQNKIMVIIQDSDLAQDENNLATETVYHEKQLINDHGLGLGLSICKKIIEAHGGTIWVENIESQGTTFRFTLPITNAL